MQPEGGVVNAIERAFAQNLFDYAQAMKSVAPDLAAAAIPCAGGTAAFLGVGSPLTTIKGAGPDITDDQMEQAEGWFRRRGVNTVVFELAPWISGETADRLARRGYETVGAEDVVVQCSPFEAPQSPRWRVERVEPGGWPDVMFQVNHVADVPHWRALVHASACLPGALHFASSGASDGWIACAQVFPVGAIAIFANDVTHSRACGRGVQTAAILERLRVAATLPFSCLTAEVAPGSASERNYIRCGFRVLYTRARYGRRFA